MRALLLALVLAAFVAAPAHAGILSPDDAADLAQSLADAQEEQDVCYGWQVDNNFGAGPDIGSSTGGPGVALELDRPGACARGIVVLDGSIYYSCDSCEDSDRASVSIRSSGMANPPTVADLKGLGIDPGGLTGDDDDTTLVNIVEALPLLVADRGNAPYVAYEAAATVPATDHATGKPGSDVLRDTWIWLVLCGALIVLGPAFYLYKRAQQPHRTAPAPTPPAPARPSVPPPT
ncbi:MAG: hypothetical protein QOG94_2648 [Solirubrobacteraceae bacterium]|jgi:hypothetical protein|nr:hypothetical protein [Solirubrobacteraceae bacterium]MEA2139125.1 hypothetical protein [Solirubrobacteraceae bacterium]